MTYEKYIKYKIKYYKLKEFEQQLISEGKLNYNNDTKLTIQNGGTNNNLKCKKCSNTIQNGGSHKLCTNCNTNILNIRNLTDTPKLNIDNLKLGKELYNQIAGNQLKDFDNDSNHSEISDIDHKELIKYNNNDNDIPINNKNNNDTDSESVLLSVFNSTENKN